MKLNSDIQVHKRKQAAIAVLIDESLRSLWNDYADDKVPSGLFDFFKILFLLYDCRLILYLVISVYIVFYFFSLSFFYVLFLFTLILVSNR